MSDKNFLNLHVLISHSPSCLNRDDMNMQKTAVFGGVRRVRVSSQCLKRAMRRSDYWIEKLGEASVRTNDLESLKTRFRESIADAALKDLVPDAVDCIVGAGRFAKKPGKGKKGKRAAATAESAEAEDGEKDVSGADAKKVAVAPWSVAEVEKVCRALKDSGGKEGKLDAAVSEALKGANESFRRSAMDIALFGRMATAGAMTSVDGALSLAHVITTHAVEEDLDWFTAMDDLKISHEGSDDKGAGHLNTQEFGAGVFYRYASLNVRQLRENLGGASRAEALKVGARLTHMLATTIPAAKQRSFAAHNLADFVLGSMTDVPVSAANAFERPVRKDDGGGFMTPSVKALEDHMTRVYAGYGLGDEQAVFSLQDTVLAPRLKTLSELEEWVGAR